MIELNEQAADELSAFDFGEFFCECSDRDCLQTVALPLVEYLRVRGSPGRLLISPGHEAPQPATLG